jgi:hypothetical protein
MPHILRTKSFAQNGNMDTVERRQLIHYNMSRQEENSGRLLEELTTFMVI